VNQAWLRVQL